MQTPAWVCKTHQYLLKTESALLVLLLVSMIVIAVLQIVLRNFFDIGLLWAQSYIRIAVLWMTLLGAMLATRTKEHIAIDVLLHRLRANWQTLIHRFTDFFSAMICFIMTYHSSLFIYSEYQDGSIAFANIPMWLCEAIIPVAFSIIACRYLLTALFTLPKKTSC